MSKKLTIEFIKSEFEKEGYTLLSVNYKNNRTKLKYICPEKHKHSIRWYAWAAGSRCPYCFGKVKKSIEFIRSEFKRENYVLLSTVYINAHKKLEYICPEGHKHSISWSNWKNGDRCPYCANNAKLTIGFISSEFKKEGYKLLTTKYKNNLQKLDYICPKGHQGSTIWSNWQKGRRCFYCFGNSKKTIEFIKNEFEKEGYKFLSLKYKNAHQKLKYICPKGHSHSITWTGWQAGKRCPTCAIINNSGNGHYNWKGGISKEPYCQDWTKEYKEYIKQRDGYRCLNPVCRKISKKLTVHHIDYNKKNCDPSNLITVCDSCNSRANYDRNWHTLWYQSILQKRYGKGN